MQRSSDGGEELLEAEGLLEEGAAVAVEIMASGIGFAAHENHGQVGAAGADGSDGSFAIHYRHLQVAEHEANVSFMLAEESEGFSAVAGAHHAIAVLFENRHDHLA